VSASWLAAWLLLVSVLAVPAFAQKRDDSQLREKQKALTQTQKQLREERAKVQAAKKKEVSLLAELEEIDRTLLAKRKELSNLDRRIRAARGEIEKLEGEIRVMEGQRAGQQEMLGRRLRALYLLHSQGGPLPMLLSEADPVTQAVQFRHLTTMATVDAGLIREFRITSEGLSERRDRAEDQRRELSSLRGQVDRERALVDQEAARRRTLLARVKDERATHERMVGELSEAAKRLEAFIRELQTKQRAIAKIPPRSGIETPATGFGTLKGRLPWPADGRIVSAFGEQVHPRFGTRTFRSGVEIEAGDGTEIAAVYPGHVVYTGWFKGYGNLIILDHGNGFYTLYAHAAEIRVREGDDVRQGQSIATVGETGSLEGPRLYFEVRYQGRPQDPSEWLRRRG
jgi:septal ring factor EnvC (AmiA/AmiB activator)